MRDDPQQTTDEWVRPQTPWARLLERVALWLEAPINRFSGTTQLNPFYHTGTIAVFLLLVVGLTGFYLFLFFQYGFDASYNAVVRMEGQPIARFMRALHRYASGAAVITVLLHAYRMLFMERFRGQRWLAWTTGILLTVLLWLGGVTGYYLLADQRAQLLNERFIDFLQNSTPFAPAFVARLVAAEAGTDSWYLFLLMLAAHVLLFLLVAGFFWIHIRRLSRPRWWPDAQWLIGMAVVLVIGSALFPVGILPQADPGMLPSNVGYDPIFLFFLPLSGQSWSPLLWLGLLLVVAAAAALPWLSRGRQPNPPQVRVLEEKCTGCTRCAIDCPYKALSMVELAEDAEHRYLAVADPEMCTSCGICIGSCTDFAITLGEAPPDALYRAAQRRLEVALEEAGDRPVTVAFACERHAHRAQAEIVEDDTYVTVLPVPCAGAVPPDLLVDKLEGGAAEVRVIGCPPDDCAHREGNLLAEQRLTRERAPRLRRAYAQVPITAVWLPPNAFDEAIHQSFDQEATNWLETRRMLDSLSWQNVVPAFAMLALVMIVQIFLTDLTFDPYPDRPAVLQIVLPDITAPLTGDLPETLLGNDVNLELTVDGATRLSRSYATGALVTTDEIPFFAEEQVQPGSHDLRLTYVSADGNARLTLFDERVFLAPGQVLRISDVAELDQPCFGPRCVR